MMLNIIKSKSYEVIRSYEEANSLSGYNSMMLSVLLNKHNVIIKIEGYRKICSEKPEPYWDIVSIKEGKLEYYHSYSRQNLPEYNSIKANLVLKGDFSMNPELVVHCFINERGMYNENNKGGE